MSETQSYKITSVAPFEHDPKYGFVDGKIWNKTGGYFLPPDEPVIVFRGKDQATLAAIMGYIECLEKQEQTPHVLEHIRTSTERLNTIMDFQIANPERAGIGCTTAEKLKARDWFAPRVQGVKP